MIKVKLTHKGQITIPIEIRRLLNVKSGDQIFFTVNDHGIVIDKWKRALTIQERLEGYNTQKDLHDHMQEIDTGENIGMET